MISPGVRVGAYEVLGLLGAGGMGEVWRARDTRLDRDVALKVLPEAFARNSDRRARLRREAKTLASLNHPSIATLFGVEETDDSSLVLVMEVVEGTTLADRLRRGPLPPAEALPVARQIAEGLEAAHQQGVLHRDLKPANIRLTPTGRVKLLDFGLAKALQPQGDLPSHLPTLSAPESLERSGVAGTAPYMSPEQARGEAVDRRTDVWAFGCVLYEMLTGRRAFPGGSPAEALAAVLGREPAWDALPAETPVSVRRLLERCLRKEKDRRLRDVGDACLELEDGSDPLTAPASGARAGAPSMKGAAIREEAQRFRRRTAVLGSVLGLLLWAVGFGLGRWRALESPGAPSTARRLDVHLPGLALPGVGAGPQTVAISRSGGRIVFTALQDTKGRLYSRSLDELDAKPIPGTENGWSPFFSPDGKWVAFFAWPKSLRKVSLEDGALVSLCDAPQMRGGSWSEDGTIVFAAGAGGLQRVKAGGGQPEPLTTPDASRGEWQHRHPQVLPGGTSVLMTIVMTSFKRPAAIGIADLGSGKHRELLEDAANPRYARGEVLFTRRGVLMAAPFSVERRELTGPAVPRLNGVLDRSDVGLANFDVSESGTLVYVPWDPRPDQRSLVWVSRSGKVETIKTPRRAFASPVLSPDGTRVAVLVEEEGAFLLDLVSGAWVQAVHGTSDGGLAWAPDGRSIFVSVGGRLQRITTDGTEREETLLEGNAQDIAASPDGRALLYAHQPAPVQWDIGRILLGGAPRAEPFLAAPEGTERQPAFSPDGRWVVFQSKAQAPGQLRVVSYPDHARSYSVPAADSGGALWSRAGLYFWGTSEGDRQALFEVQVQTTPDLRFGTPRRLFDVPEALILMDVTRDGQRILGVEQEARELQPLRLVVASHRLR